MVRPRTPSENFPKFLISNCLTKKSSGSIGNVSKCEKFRHQEVQERRQILLLLETPNHPAKHSEELE
jgi:hypothetical protein